MNNSLIYLACPYSHPDKDVQRERFHAANKAGAFLMCKGLFVFSPISHTHPMAEDANLPGHWEFWKSYDVAMIARCQKLMVLKLDGWEQSTGVTAEIKIAKEFGIPIEYMEPLFHFIT
jgi:hypothetical protein